MKISIEITDDTVEKVVRGIMENFPEASAYSALRCSGWSYEEMLFKFHDEENKTHKLDKEKLVATFPLIFTDKWPKGCTKPPTSNDMEVWNDWLGQSDATDFDAFVQLACFGEVIYG